MIFAERQKQIEKGFTADHDDQHRFADLAVVAAVLAVHGTDASVDDPLGRADDLADPWGLIERHGHDRVRLLQIAGALIAAELDRVDRRERRRENQVKGDEYFKHQQDRQKAIDETPVADIAREILKEIEECEPVLDHSMVERVCRHVLSETKE